MSDRNVLNPDVTAYYKMTNDNQNNSLISAAKCISQCRGCQCKANPVTIESIFEEIVINPMEKIYNTVLGAMNKNVSVSAARCNCTACNACRCDCSCRAIPTDPSAIWA